MDCDELYISLLFPPSDYVSGISVFKRIADNKRPADVFQLKSDSSNDDFDEFINERIGLDLDCELDTPSCIMDSLEMAMELIRKDYMNIFSRSWVMNNHFIALEYKFSNPDVFWTAEFSDPVILNITNKVRNNKKFNLNNPEYVSKVNGHIKELNNKNDTSFPLIEEDMSVFYLTEYLTYLFADKIIFTNENQREVMLDNFDDDIREFAANKSEIQMHSTLGEEFYHLKPINMDLDNNCINIAYFGRDYYGQRHFESLFYSLETLNHKFKDKVRIHLFADDVRLLKKLTGTLDSSDNFIIEKPLDYFEFLNACTQFDVLIVNDVITRGTWPVNPYLPSKLSDYLGSSSDIWALYEDGSTLSKLDLKYKSDIADFNSCRNQLIKILTDYGFRDDDCTFDDGYYLKRLTTLNKLYESEYRKVLKYEKENRELKKENRSLKKVNDEVFSSNSWKLTKPFRYIKNNR